MMTDSVEGETSNGGGSAGKHDLQARRAAYAHALGYYHALTYGHLRANVSLAVKGSGLLALLLSTVILLGGYVQSLEKKDFFCVMIITVTQAAGIFQDWDTNINYFMNFVSIIFSALDLMVAHIPALALVVLPFAVLTMCALLFYLVGPLACAAISSWRIGKLNHSNNRDANMIATLNIFYSLIIFHGTMFLVLLLPMNIYREIVVRRLQSLEQLSDKWGEKAIRRYIFYIGEKSRKDPLFIKGRDLIKYAAELLDSESQEDYLYGARLLSAFVNKGEDVSWVLLPSRHRIQRLIDSLMTSCSNRHGRCYAVIGSGLEDKKEIRELAAMIVANVAAHIDDLSNYPAAARCISSLLQTTHPPPHHRPIGPLTEQEHYQEKRMQRLIIDDEKRHKNLMSHQNRREIREHQHRNRREGGTSNELVQQGLTILGRLASNSDDNRKLICSTPGLLPKITALVYSTTLLEDVKTKAWTDIVTRCLKVLYQLIRAPDCRHEIFSNKVQALRNLKGILELGNTEADHQELLLVTMEILTELALDLSINLTGETKKVLITKQLQLFVSTNGDDEEESAAIAGREMVSLSTNCEGYSALIMSTEDSIIDYLAQIILNYENITRRTIAAEIMANLCAHCNVDGMKELLTEVLIRKIMPTKTKSQERNISGDQNNPALGDEENQENFVSRNDEETHNISTQGDDPEIEEISDQEKEEQEAFFSLAQVICGRLNSADLDDAIQKAVDRDNAGTEEQRREAFVEKLKTIIDDNCRPAADCLRIVKLCGQTAKSVMQCEQYAEIFRNKGFKSSLSKASETMSKLESCMLFVGTDFGLKKTVRPLLSEIEESFGQI